MKRWLAIGLVAVPWWAIAARAQVESPTVVSRQYQKAGELVRSQSLPCDRVTNVDSDIYQQQGPVLIVDCQVARIREPRSDREASYRFWVDSETGEIDLEDAE
ncbi:MAG: hypothetical protein AAF978_00695 [Cyanobacteria bacterium P01_E01_bin.48]